MTLFSEVVYHVLPATPFMSRKNASRFKARLVLVAGADVQLTERLVQEKIPVIPTAIERVLNERVA